MTETTGTLTRALDLFAGALEPLADELTDETTALGLLATLGVNAPLVPQSLLAVRPALLDVANAVTELEQVIAAEGEDSNAALSKLGELSVVLAVAVAKIVELEQKLEQDFAAYPDVLARIDFGALAKRLLDYVLVVLLRAQLPLAYNVLLLLGVLHVEAVAPEDAEDDITSPHLSYELRWGRLKTLASKPSDLFAQVYGWGTVEFDHFELLERLQYVLRSAGLVADFLEVPTVVGIPAAGTELRLPLFEEVTETDSLSVGFGAIPVAPGQGGTGERIALRPILTGAARTTFELRPALKLSLKAAFSLESPAALVVAPPGRVSLELGLGGQSASIETGLEWERESGARVPIFTIPSWLVLDAAGVRAAVILTADAAGVRPAVEAGLVDTRLKIDGSKADGFIKKILPDKGIEAKFGVGLGWAGDRGVYLTGGGGQTGAIETSIPLHVSILGIIDLETVYVTIAVATGRMDAAVAADLTAKIGPVAAAVERIGASMKLAFPPGGGNVGPAELSLGFKPPKGAGLSIKAGPVTGGGYISFDPDNEQYAGILELSFKAISITAIALLTTRLPDASGPPGATKKGFSLLVIIAVELPPIQLGYGFTLNGVGGLFGANRTMVVDALRNGVRDGSVNAILFPQDAVRRATQIISQLRSIFPPAEGRFVFGPMVKVGWGPNAILEVSAAVVLELMAPIRLVILGRIQAAIPDKKETVLNLRLDIVGVLDFDRGEISVDASLVDSRLTAFVLTGDMALRVGWGATKIFALAAGGFHPRYQPPAGFPALRRLGIALANSDNPRLRMEAYLALTANTIQFGAALDAYVKVDTFVGTFSAAANMNFDALIQFQPFEITAELGAAIDIARNGTPLLHAALHAAFTGPTPWHAIGYAEFDFLGKRRIDFEATVGEPATPPLLEMEAGKVLEEVVKAFSRPDAWSALPPADADRIVSLRDQEPGAAVVIHPLGSLSARQRVLPLGKAVDRFGTAVVAPTTFALQGFRVGSSTVTTPPAEDFYDDFAPGQFTALSDDERLARPAFESMRSGGRAAVTSVSVPSDRRTGVSAASGYEESVVDVEPETGLRSASPQSGKPADIPDEALADLVHGGAAAKAETRVSGAAQFRGPDLAVAVVAERYVLAGADTLAPLAGAPTESSAEAHDRLARRSPSAAPAQATPAREAA